MADNLVTREIRRLNAATRVSLKGLRMCWQNEAAFRFEVLLAVFFIPLGLWLGASPAEKALLAGTSIIVMIVEVLNSGIEAVVDRIGQEKHELSALAKDLGSAAVLLSMVLFWLVWGLILFL